jgi:F0F1-type ATP synthase assembly protein I
MIQFLLKLVLSLTFIVTATYVGRKAPSLGGLIATMPSTGLLVMIWLYTEHSGDHSLMEEYSKGALLGVFPTVLFFLAAFLCFRKHLPFSFALSAGFASWLLGAFLHQWLTRFFKM